MSTASGAAIRIVSLKAEVARLRRVNAVLVEAMKSIIAVADRKTDEFDRAKAALRSATETKSEPT